MTTHRSLYRAIRKPFTQSDLEKALPIAEYARLHNYSIDGVRDRIATGKLKAIKWAGKLLCY
jgi:hypothetical protein